MCSTTSKPSRSRRRTRSRTRKPKYASLRDRLTTTPLPHQQPLGMGNNQLEREPDGDPQVACLLEQVDETEGCVTISTLFGASASSSAAFEEVPSPVSSSMDRDWDGEGLARRALRGRERWVFCRSTSFSMEETVSRGSRGWVDLLGSGVPSQRLSLKLDYKEILTAWSDKGSLYIDGEGPQVVPDLQQIYADDCTTPNVFVEVGNNGNIVSVPEMEVDQQEDGRKKGEMNRKERVIRYKEKRQSRLFSKRIRYEVRKLNAEKRPRVKGRFVKRNDDMIGSSLLENKRK